MLAIISRLVRPTFFIFLVFFTHSATAIPVAPKVDARSALLIDFHTGKVLVEKSAQEQIEPASLTKMMTAYIIYDEITKGRISLESKVQVSEKAWRMEGSRMFLEVGSTVNVSDLLKGLVIQSGNDASVVLAELVAGDEDSFADYMNQYADKLGMNNSHFMNSTGLPHKNHYTTATDMAILARGLIQKFPEYYKTYSQKEFTFNKIRQTNRNRLLWRDKSVDGIKTGHTKSAGYSLVASAKKDQMRLISIVMGTKSSKARTRENAKLLRYGFSFFETHKVYQAGQPIDTARIWKGTKEALPVGLQNDLFVTIERGQYSKLDASILLNLPIIAPLNIGDKIGNIEIKLAEELLVKRPVVALEDIPKGGIFSQLMDTVLLYFQ